LLSDDQSSPKADCNRFECFAFILFPFI